MPDRIPYLNVFLSSPGDVPEERAIARKVMKRLPNRFMFRGKVALNIIAWDDPESGTAMEATLTPQEAIKRGLTKPSECDIVIVILWSRLGTPFVDTDGKWYESGTHWELLDALRSSKTHTFIYHRTEKPNPGELDSPRFYENVDQYRRLQQFLKSEIFVKDSVIQRSVQDYAAPSDFETIFEFHFEQIVAELLASFSFESYLYDSSPALSETNTDIAKTLNWPADRSPFPGMRAFTEQETDIFFGRETEIDGLVRQLTASRFLAVVGASGSGKSSLVRAGLIPRLRANAISGSKDWKIAIFRLGEKPLESLYDALLDIFPQLSPNAFEHYRSKQNFVDKLREAPKSLITIVHDQLRESPQWVEVLFFVDQFEELFKLGGEDVLFFIAILDAVAKSKQMRVVVTMRTDVFSKAVENQILAELLRAEAVFSLANPNHRSLRQMIERPAERAALMIEDELVERILDDIGKQPGNLYLMAYMLYQLYIAREDNLLLHMQYERLGTIQGMIDVQAQNTFSRLSSEIQKALRHVILKFVDVTEEGEVETRSTPLSVFAVDDSSLRLVEVFIEVGLLTVDHKYDDINVEVAYKALFNYWGIAKEILTSIKEDFQLFTKARQGVQEWKENGKDLDYLWREPRAKRAYEAIVRLELNMEDELKEFILFSSNTLLENSVFGPPSLTSQYVVDIFMLMPFREEMLPIYRDHVKSVAEDMGLSSKRADDFFTKYSIMSDIWSGIYSANLILADCTNRNPNVFYELGIAHTVGKPTIMITQKTEDIPFDLRHLRHITYDFTPPGMRIFEETIRFAIRNLTPNVSRSMYTSTQLIIDPNSNFGLPSSAPQHKCDVFMIMPFRPELQGVYTDSVRKVVQDAGLSIKRGDDFFTKYSIMSDIWSAINACEFLIADCTGRNVNVFYEMGIAHTLGKPVILITQNPQDVPYDLQHFRYIQYEYTPPGMRQFEIDLKNAINGIMNFRT